VFLSVDNVGRIALLFLLIAAGLGDKRATVLTSSDNPGKSSAQEMKVDYPVPWLRFEDIRAHVHLGKSSLTKDLKKLKDAGGITFRKTQTGYEYTITNIKILRRIVRSQLLKFGVS